jgi:hypothetical protein
MGASPGLPLSQLWHARTDMLCFIHRAFSGRRMLAPLVPGRLPGHGEAEIAVGGAGPRRWAPGDPRHRSAVAAPRRDCVRADAKAGRSSWAQAGQRAWPSYDVRTFSAPGAVRSRSPRRDRASSVPPLAALGVRCCNCDRCAAQLLGIAWGEYHHGWRFRAPPGPREGLQAHRFLGQDQTVSLSCPV